MCPEPFINYISENSVSISTYKFDALADDKTAVPLFFFKALQHNCWRSVGHQVLQPAKDVELRTVYNRMICYLTLSMDRGKTSGMLRPICCFRDVCCCYPSGRSCWAWCSSDWMSLKYVDFNACFSQACFKPSGYSTASYWVVLPNPG